MEINVRRSSYGAEIIIEVGSAKVTEDVSPHELDGQVQQFVSAAFELSKADKMSDLETVQSIINNHLNSSEKQELAEWLKDETHG